MNDDGEDDIDIGEDPNSKEFCTTVVYPLGREAGIHRKHIITLFWDWLNLYLLISTVVFL